MKETANEQIEAIRRGFDAMRRGDADALIDDCDPEIEFVSLVGQVEGGNYHGHDGIRRFLSDLAEAWEVWLPWPERFEVSGDVLLATGRTQLRGKESGVELTMDWGQVFHFRDGKVLWAKIYSDRAEADKAFRALAGR